MYSKLEDARAAGTQICFIFPATHKLSWLRWEETEHVFLERHEYGVDLQIKQGSAPQKPLTMQAFTVTWCQCLAKKWPNSYQHEREASRVQELSYLKQGVVGRDVGVVVPAGGDAVEQHLLGRAVVLVEEPQRISHGVLIIPWHPALWQSHRESQDWQQQQH